MKFLASVFSTFCAFGLLSTAASAADLLRAQPEPVVKEIPQVHDWRGSYIGLQVGGGFGGEFSADDNLGTVLDGDLDGVVGGVLFGYNFQRGNVVFGIDSDFSGTGINGTAGAADVNLYTLGTTRARVGYAFDRVLPYATGGLATSYANFDQSAIGIGDDSSFLFGWTAGAGVEVAVTPNISARLQYNYIDLSENDFSFTSGPIDLDVDELHVVRAGVSIKTRSVFSTLFGR